MIGKFFNNLGKRAKTTKKAGNKGEYKRFNDAILVIMQDNSGQALPVKACNERALKLIGYSEQEIADLDLRDLLPPDTRELVNDYIEYTAKGRAVGQVLQKIPNFRLLANHDREIPIKLRVVPGVSDATHPIYNLVMADSSLLETLKTERQNYSALNTKEFLIRSMAHVIKHGEEYGYASSFAVINFKKAGANIKRAEKMIESTKRDTDIIGQYNESTLIYIMPDTPTTNAITPLVRFESSLSEDLRSVLYVRYVKLDHNLSPVQQIKDCMEGKTGSKL